MRRPAATLSRVAALAGIGPRSALAPITRFRIAALFAAQLFDFGTFMLMVERHGIVAEANPIVVNGFVAFGLPFIAVAKIALVVLVGSIVVVLGRDGPGRRVAPRLAAGLTVLGVVGGLVGGISNLLPMRF